MTRSDIRGVVNVDLFLNRGNLLYIYAHFRLHIFGHVNVT